MNTRDQHTRKMLRDAQKLARSSVNAYLKAARLTSDRDRACALEAAAIERAVVAAQLGRIVDEGEKEEEDQQAQHMERAQASDTCNPVETDRKLHRVCRRIHQWGHDHSLRKLSKDILRSTTGLAELPA